MRSVCILGSTGSIGQSTLRVIREYREEFRVSALVCNRNLELFKKQIEEFRPDAAAVADEEVAASDEFRALTAMFPQTQFFAGQAGILQLVRNGGDILLSAIVGAAGLLPTLEAIPCFSTIALANKETLVVAGDLVRSKISAHGTQLLPVDSEHSAVFSLLHGRKHSDLRRIILTASGGSLRDYPAEALTTVTPAQALAHPTWDMGAKITIDSATLMNKGLEVIEAHHLFDVAYDRISVLVHPESIIHSLIEMNNGEIFAQMGVTDMVFPILNALMYPEIRQNGFGFLDLAAKKSLTFREFEEHRYPALALCYAAGKEGGTMPAVLNAANEIAVGAFLENRISFPDIVSTVERVMQQHTKAPSDDLETLLAADTWARQTARTLTRGQ